MKIIKWIILVIVVTTLAKCGYDEVIYGTPKVNPHPTQKVRIHGKFPFDKNVTLVFVSVFENKNPKCNKVFRTFGFVAHESPKKYDVNISVAKTANNEYEATFYLDQVKPGICEWEIVDLENWTHLNMDGGGGSKVNFLKFIDKVLPKNNINLECSKFESGERRNLKTNQIYTEWFVGCFAVESKGAKQIDPQMPYYEIPKTQKDIQVDFTFKGEKQ